MVSDINNPVLRIDTEGIWYYGDTPIQRAGLVRLFYTALQKCDEGYALITPAESVPIVVDDAPFAVIAVHSDENTNITLTLNDGTLLPLDNEHPLRQSENNILYVKVFERGGHAFEARFTLASYLALAEFFECITDTTFVLKSFGREFRLHAL
ncbi:MAG: DUF1285 domain-containing protein [Bacteroidota bacterium]|nr:DUF1285 domain-containing protein [Candidatus Kapabacteria bacterium]MDW8218993.1 DUF1285 domain-containing protein [Bacteroidota bacterium]